MSNAKDSAEMQVSAAEFVLEGLHAHKKIGRNEERVFSAGEKPPKKQERVYEPEEPGFGRKRGFDQSVVGRWSLARSGIRS